jgi:restriction system protein
MSIEEKTIWGIHAGKTGEEESLFLDKRVIAVGWVEFGSLDGLKTREDFKEKYAQIYADASVQSVATSAGQLFRFVHEMQVGDLVAYLAKKSRQIHIGTVTGEYEYRPEVNSNYPNQRSVEWLEHLSRTKFSQGALYEMGSALSIEDQTRDFVLKQLERNLKGLPLEEFIKHLLEKMGYRARLMPANEPSVDIIAHKDELGFEPPIIRVQVKSSPDKVSDKDVSALYGKVGYSEFGLLVTLGEFTYPAWQFATGKGNLRLIDGTELVELILEHYDDFDPRYKGIVPLKKVYIPQSLEGEE